jgi:hypothetical protein
MCLIIANYCCLNAQVKMVEQAMDKQGRGVNLAGVQPVNAQERELKKFHHIDRS